MIPLTKISFDEKETNAVKQVILSGWITQGPKVVEFEKQFASFVGADFACATSSCTTALHLSLLAVGVQPGEVVITVSHSFIATANSIRYTLCEPVFIDINPITFNIDANLLKRCLTEDCSIKKGQLFYKKINRLIKKGSPLSFLKKVSGRVAAIIVVHQMGFPCDLLTILNLAKKFKLPVIEDAACAIGSEISFNHGKTFEKIGKPHGNIACFSFHPRKLITCGDGGMITTNNYNYCKKIKLLRQHYMSVPDTIRHHSQKVFFENYPLLGFNFRMTDLQAAIGIEQLKKINKIIKKRRELALEYSTQLKKIPWIILTESLINTKPNWQSYPIKISAGINQKKFMQYLLNIGIATRRGIMNAHTEGSYSNMNWSLPYSETTRDKTVLLPLYPEMNQKDVKFITNLISQFNNT